MLSSRRFSFILGLVIVFSGLVWFLNNLGLVQVGVRQLIGIYWPLLLVIWGLDRLMERSQHKKGRGGITTRISIADRIAVILVIGLGLLVLGNNLELYSLDFSILWALFWPAVLIIIGWSLLRGSMKTKGTSWAVMSGLEYCEEGWKLDNRSFFAFMGGIELDLTRARIEQEETYLNLTAVMGGITVKVPRDIEVECKGTAYLGGLDIFDDSLGGVYASRQFLREGEGDTGYKIYIRGRALMGGIEVVNGKR